MWAVLLLGWMACIIIAALIYERRGHLGLGGVAAGALLGPLGVLLVMLIPESQTGIARNQLQAGQRKRCPHCAEIIQPAARVCRYCGRDQPQP